MVSIDLNTETKPVNKSKSIDELLLKVIEKFNTEKDLLTNKVNQLEKELETLKIKPEPKQEEPEELTTEQKLREVMELLNIK